MDLLLGWVLLVDIRFVYYVRKARDLRDAHMYHQDV